MKKYKLAGLVIATFLVFAYLQSGDKPQEKSSSPSLNGASVASTFSVRGSKSDHKNSLPIKKEDRSSVAAESSVDMDAVKSTLVRFVKDANRIHSGLERAKIFANWSTKPEVLTWFEKVLSDPSGQKDKMDASQLAMARVYGIKFFEYLAEQQRPEFVLNAVRHTIEDLKGNTQPVKGRRQDLADLTAVYVNTYSEAELTDEGSIVKLMRELGLDSSLDPRLSEIVDDEIYLALYPLVGKRKAARLMDDALGRI
ncbi:hypothetical protein N9D31_01355 [Oligoflexaceae bacterium]|nr:hypothetical protein [Oligoflexaceae bacterium]